MDKTQNNINSLEEIKRAFFTNFASLMLDEEDYEVETDDVTVLVWNFFEPYLLITTHEQQAYEKAKMELEVEIGLQKFGQLMKEKEAIIQQARRNAVEEFAEWHNDIPDYAIEAVCKVDKEDIEKFLKRKIST